MVAEAALIQGVGQPANADNKFLVGSGTNPRNERIQKLHMSLFEPRAIDADLGAINVKIEKPSLRTERFRFDEPRYAGSFVFPRIIDHGFSRLT
ncbi:MAG: hypothetical protein ABI120_12315, partial [Gemmatimonadaceae bacterium]